MLVRILVSVNTGKTEYMEVELHRCMLANEHITVGSNSYEKVKTLEYLDFLLTNKKFYSRGNDKI